MNIGTRPSCQHSICQELRTFYLGIAAIRFVTGEADLTIVKVVFVNRSLVLP